MRKRVCCCPFFLMTASLVISLAVAATGPATASYTPVPAAHTLVGSTPSRADLPPGARPGYLIVAPAALAENDVFEDFVAFKRGLGFDVYTQSIEWITNNLVGDDFPEKLRNYLQIAYLANTSGPRNVRYTLLVGTDSQIPFRIIRPRAPDQNGQASTDWYYADLTGDWDSNDNGVLGEGLLLDDPTDEADLHYEVAIGRLPFSAPENVRRALGTMMAFESEGSAWKMNTIQAGAFMQFTGLTWAAGAYHAHGAAFEEYFIGEDTDTAALMEAIWDDALQPWGMNRTRLFEIGLNANNVPQSSFAAEFPLDRDNLVAAWNAAQHGLVNLAGHGNEESVYQYHWDHDYYDDDLPTEPTEPMDTGDGLVISRRELTPSSYLDADDAPWLDPPLAIAPPYEPAPVVAVEGCGTAWTASGHGLGVTLIAQGKASAFYGSTGTTGLEPGWTGNTGTGVGPDLVLRFNQLLVGPYPRLGDATYQTAMQLFDETTGEPRGRALVKNVLFGDPAMSYWGAGAEFDGPWPMFRHDTHNSGLTTYSGPALGAVRWTFPLNPAPFTNGVPSPIVGRDGTIYAGNALGILYAINPDGTEKWHYQAGGAINAGPILTTDGTLYFRAEDGYLYAVDRFGDFRWRAPMELFPGTAGPTPGQSPFSNSPRVTSDGTVLALAAIDMGDGFSIYNGYRPTGERIWAEQAAGFGSAGTPAIADDGAVYFSYWNGTLNTGFDLGAPSLGSPAIGSNDAIVVGTINGRLLSISPAMAEEWHYDVAGTINDINSSPAVGEDNSVYFGVTDNNVYALNSNGTLRWKYDTGGPVDSSPALDDEAAYVVGGPDGHAKLYALDRRDGSLRWSVTIGGRSVLASSPAIGYGKMVYVASQDGILFAIGPAGPLPPSDALAQAVSPFEIDVSWRDNSDDEAGFRLERREGWAGPYQVIATLGPNEAFYTDKSVLANQTYFYRVLALGSSYSGYANVCHARTPPPAPGAPTGLAATGESSYGIRLQWDSLGSGALGAEILRSLTAAGPFIRVGLVPGDVTQFVDVNPAAASGKQIEDGHPQPGQSYFYKIRAFNEAGNSPYSTPVSGQTLSLNLTPPSSLQAVVHDFSWVVLAWGVGPSDLAGYIVERSSSDQPDYEIVATLSATTTSYEDHALDSGYHTYRIRAFNSTDNSPFVKSNTVYIPELVRRVYLPIVRR
ncbi:MAG: PQQ-binding-like beta-propeller repeat protein [Anaerolineae bacterium]|nr:PQQ-binding-like beta-propeller repeat protein [Anaerolineae bacterium]